MGGEYLELAQKRNVHVRISVDRSLLVYNSEEVGGLCCIACVSGRWAGVVLCLTLFISAQSNAMDRSFGLCAFVDDPSPLKDRIRSADYKVLLRKLRFCVTSIESEMLDVDRIFCSSQGACA